MLTPLIESSSDGEHLRVLSHAGVVTPKRIRQWTFYKRNEKRITEVKRELRSVW